VERPACDRALRILIYHVLVFPWGVLPAGHDEFSGLECGGRGRVRETHSCHTSSNRPRSWQHLCWKYDGVLQLVALAAGIAGARQDASAAVHAELEAHGVHLVRHGLEAIGPLHDVGHKAAAGVARFLRLAIVDVGVRVSEVLKAWRDRDAGGVGCGRCVALHSGVRLQPPCSFSIIPIRPTTVVPMFVAKQRTNALTA